MSPWIDPLRTLYRAIARVFPRRFRVTCGDGLEQLGQDLVPIIWREQGVAGMLRLFADLIVRLPAEYLAAWSASFKELLMADDMLEGTWRARNDQSQWDPNYTPEQACLRVEATDNGYLVVAYGIKDGEAVAERPTAIIADGRRRPLVT